MACSAGFAGDGDRAEVQRAQTQVTVAVGEIDLHKAADTLLDLSVELAIVKQHPAGGVGKTRHESVVLPPNPVQVLNGLGTGDSFGANLIHGVLDNWPLEKTLRYANAAEAIVASRLECSTAESTAVAGMTVPRCCRVAATVGLRFRRQLRIRRNRCAEAGNSRRAPSRPRPDRVGY